MKKIKTLLLLLLLASTSFAQSLSPRVTATAGGRATGGGVSLSYTTGETFNTKLSANNKQLTQGQQQPEIDLRLGISQATACAGANLSVPFSAAGYVDASNVFSVQLSDANGSFANPVTIGSATSMVSGSITATIPSGVSGVGYKARLVSSHPAIISGDLVALTVSAVVLSASATSPICAGTNLTLTATGGARNALAFTSNSYVGISSLDISPAVFPTLTASAWVYRTGTSTFSEIISNDDGGYDRAIVVASDGNYHIFAGRDINTGIPSVINKWEFISVTWSPSGITFYKNGVSVFTTTVETESSGIRGTRIGNGTIQNAASSFIGAIDQVSVFSSARTASELQNEMNFGLLGSEPGLQAFYLFNEGTGTTTADASPYARTGSFSSNPAPTWISSSAPTGFASYLWSPGGQTTPVISVSPTTSTNYSVQGTNAFSCSTTSNAFNLTVNPIPVGSATAQTSCNGVATSVALNSTVSGTTFTWTAALQSGTVTGFSNQTTGVAGPIAQTLTNSTTTAGVVRYTITPTANGCSGTPFTVDVTVAATYTVGTASTSPTLCINTALTNITHSTTGATGIGTATGLPTGVTASWANNLITISGTPTQSGTFNYTIPLAGGCATLNATGSITVNAINTVSVASSTPTLCINTALTNITHTTTGATGIGTATGLPTGVTASWANNLITIGGTPTQSGTFNYTIPLTGGCGSVNAAGTIKVAANVPTITSFTPVSGSPGTLVTILGTNLYPNSLSIGGVSAIVVSTTGNTLVGMVMPGATTGGISINNACGQVSSNLNFTVTPTSYPFTQQGNSLEGTNQVSSQFNTSVSVSADGNTAIVGGAADDSNKGAFWIYTRSGSTWTQQGNKMVGAGAIGTARQGLSVALSADGNTAIVGGPGDDSNNGAAWIYTRSGGVWTQQGNKMVGTGAIGTARQGFAVSLSADGNTAIVGGVGDDSFKGAAWIYTRSGGVWTQQGNKMVGAGAIGSARQGNAVALSADGNTAIVGGNNDDSNNGAAWIYTRSGGVWTQQGNKMVGSGASIARQGNAVALSADGNTAIVGGNNDASYRGAAWIYTRSGGVWTQQGSKLNYRSFDGYTDCIYSVGTSVSLSADGYTAMVTGFNNCVGDYGLPSAQLYTRLGNVWSFKTELMTQELGQPFSIPPGGSLSLDGNTGIIGAIFATPGYISASVYTTGIKYNGNQSTGGTAPADNAVQIGSSIILPGNTGFLEKTRYRFIGWNTNADGSGTSYAPGDNIVLSASMVLYAQWSCANENIMESISTCGVPYTWHGVTYTQSGTYTYGPFTNTLGCDSLNTLELTINEIPTATIAGNSGVCNGNNAITLNTQTNIPSVSITATPLDEISGAKLAVGLRKLSTTYNGSALRLRRSSDNQEQDFGFAGNDLDVNAIATWLNGASGYCTKLYDQSGNGGDVTQSNTNAQPLLVLSGINNKPILRFTTAQTMLNAVNYSTPYSVIYGSRVTGASSRVLSAKNNNWLLGYWGTKEDRAYFDGWVFEGMQTTVPNQFNIYACSGNGSISSVYKNGYHLASNNSGLSGPKGIQLNGTELFGERSNCEFTDVIIFGSMLSPVNVAKLNNAIASYYGEVIFNPISYLWSTGATTPAITVNTVGNYAVTVTNNATGCSTNTSVEVKNPSSTTNVTNCSPYLWNGVNYTSSGVYTYITPSTYGCDSTAILNLTVISNTAGAASTSPTLCINTPLTNITHTTTLATGIIATDLPTYSLPPAVANPTVDEDLGNVTISLNGSIVLNNTTPINSLSGTIGTASGTAGGYADFTAFGPYAMYPGSTYSFSLSSITSRTSLSYYNSMAIYIDYNRNGVFTDAGENVYAASATTSGPHTETGTFTIPATAALGLTRMRVLCHEGGLITSPTQSISYGEYEEYRLNIGGFNIAPLPPGVTASWASNIITISGTPTQSGTFNYSIPLTGGCGNVNATGTITVSSNNAAGPGSSTPTLCINTALPAITHSTTGATGIGTASGLPTGVTASWLNNVITISGTPTQSGTFNYSIPLTGGCGSVNATGTITVNPNNTVSAASSTPTLCLNTPLTNITHSTTGATGIGTASGLPPGVTASWANNIITISGTPTQSGTFNYSIPLSGGCGSVNATGTITVVATPTVIINCPAFCSGASTTVSATPGAAGTYSYLWTVPSGATNPGNVSSFNTSTVGTYSVVITSQTTNCSSIPAIGTVALKVSPTAAITGSTSFCDGGNTQLNASATAGIHRFKTTAAGGYHSLFLENDGVWATGSGYSGQFGNGNIFAHSNTPVKVGGLSGITAIAAGGNHSLFLKNDGTVWATGYGYAGQLGNGNTENIYTPVQVSGLSGITAIAGGGNHSLFLKNDGTVWATGSNTSGQLGDGSGASKKTPVQVIGLSGITAIAAGGNHSLFLKNDGTVRSTGLNTSGQLGDGTFANKYTPVQVSVISGITAIAAGLNHSLFLNNNGTVRSTGLNTSGQLGDGTVASKKTPVMVSGLSDITAIAAGLNYSLFLKNDSTIRSTGSNGYGQLGDGTVADKKTPVQVIATSTITSYQWMLNGSNLSGETNALYTAASVGNYSVMVTNSDGCTAAASAPVTVIPPVVTVNSPGVCSGASTTLVASSTASTNQFTYLPVDRVAGATLAVGLRKLRSSYAGSALRLRRSSDNQEQDFGFAGSDLDMNSINTWLNGASAYCTKLYDQSGSGGDVSQANVTAQPLLVLSGLNNKPILRFTTNQTMFNDVNYPAPFSVIYGSSVIGTSARVLSTKNNNWLLGYWGGNEDEAYFEGWVNESGISTVLNQYNVYAATGTGSESALYKNGVQIVSNGEGLEGPNGIQLNGSDIFGEYSDVDITDVIIYGSALSSGEINVLNNSISSYYGGEVNNQNSYLWSTGATTSSISVNTAGTYTVSVISPVGCTTIATSTVTLSVPSESTTHIQVCSAQLPYVWNGASYTESGVYTFNGTNAAGCDSVSTLDLTIIICPNTTTLNLTAYLEGFYTGNGTMRANLYDLGISTNDTETDSIEVNLWSATNLSAATPDYSVKTIIHTNGTIAAVFPGATLNNDYYVALKHRNSMEVWSAEPVTIASTTSYDFSTSMSAAYGNGFNDPMKSISVDRYAIFGGDVNQDGTVDLFDAQITDNGAANLLFGYDASDCNGDGSTDLFDLQLIDNNSSLLIYYARPF